MRRLPLALLPLLLAASCRTSSGAPHEANVPPNAEAGPAQTLPPIDQAAFDRSVSPCDDFFQFACGGWIASHPIPADKPRWSRFDELAESNQRDLRAILEAEAAGKLDPRDRFTDKVADFYAACMDEAAVERDGTTALAAQWAKIDAMADRGDLAGEIARLDREGIAIPFVLTSDQDLRDATQVIAWLYQGGLGLPDREYYLSSDERSARIRELYVAHMKKMFALAGVAPERVEKDAAAILDMEKAIATSHWTRVEMRDPKRTYNRVDVSGLEKLAPQFPWTRWLRELGHPEITAISASTPRSVEEVGRLFAEAPLPQWRAYLRWHVLSSATAARALPRAFVDEQFAFRSAAFTGAKELEPRWKACVKATDHALGEALGQTYVRLHFGEEAKARTVELVQSIEKALDDDISGLAWMEPATKARAREKLHLVSNKVGYPKVWRDYTAMKVSRTDHFANVLAASAFELQRQLAKVGKPVDRNEWHMSPPTVNAYYDSSLNEMVFPAGILQPPFWSRLAPPTVNFGAIGMVVGHELTHGFDDQGRQFDGHGNLTDWWTPEDAKRFGERARCLVRQFGAYEPVAGTKLNGELTLGENIADLGGLKLAWSALGARVSPPQALDGFTPSQQFFVGMAQIWCTATRETFARMLAMTDPHSAARFRVNGPLSNTPDFARAFQCREGSPMVRPPAERCEVW